MKDKLLEGITPAGDLHAIDMTFKQISENIVKLVLVIDRQNALLSQMRARCVELATIVDRIRKEDTQQTIM